MKNRPRYLHKLMPNGSTRLHNPAAARTSEGRKHLDKYRETEGD
jgi:hypothetical protein